MRWITLAIMSLFCFSSLQALDYDETFANEEEMLTLDSEIEAMLEEEGFDETDLDTQIGMENYDELDEILGEEEFIEPEIEKNTAPLPVKNAPKKMQVQEIENNSIAIQVDKIVAEEEPMVVTNAPLIDTIKEETAKTAHNIEINLKQVFSGSPIIYSLLFLLSTISVCVWLYSMLTIRSIEFLPPKLIKDLRTKLISNQFDEALDLCVKQKHFFCKMLASGILARRYGLSVMVDTMKAEGKRSTVSFWQRINILNEIAIIAPMIGLLGTVLGMFYAFYDLNRSIESVSLLFDGLGISVGTTVAGLGVAILAMILYSIAKYRLVRILANVENEAQVFGALIDTRGPNYLEK
ncbi:MAG: hypothetical protein K1000chlam3_01081 [Chlamydiae bacterium]|nr:hypothetical protein [Chlamydiota bacterium]